MKKKFTNLITAALMLLTMMARPVTVWGQTRAEVVAYTLDGSITGSGSNYATGNSITQNEISWIVTGNTQMSPWRIGGKSISNVDRPVYSTGAISDNITKIEVTHGTASGITVNSWTVIVASDADFTNVVSTLTPTFAANATTTINRPTGADWTNCYYKFIYNVTVTQTSNKFLQFVKADFYKQEGSGTVIATPTFSPAAGTYISAQSVTISCETANSTIYYTMDGSTPDNTSTEYNGAITVSETKTINAIAYVGSDASSVATATYTIVNLEHAGTETDPYSVADARAAIDAGTGVTGVYATGIVSEIPTAWNTTYNNITFNFVDNSGDTDFLQAYRCGSGTGVDASEVAVGDIVVVYGNLTKYGTTYEFGQGCEIVTLTHTVTTHELTFSANPTEGGTVTVGTYTSPATIAEGATADITATPNAGYVFSGWEVTGAGSSVADATSATTIFTMGTADATLTANFTPVPTYTVTYYPNVTGTAPIELTYNAGEDVTVANNTFSNPGFAFSEWNTDPAGDGDPYSPGDVIQNISANYSLYAQWIVSNETTDVLNWAATGSPTNYTDWTYNAPSGTAYAGQSSGTYQSIQLRSNNDNSGIVTTTSVGNATKVVVSWNSNTTAGRTLNIYGKNTAYTDATDLYGANAGELLGTIVCGTSTEFNISGGYAYIGMRSASGALYLDEVNITWNTSGVVPPSITASNVEIAYNETSGEIGYTINNPVTGGSLTASTLDGWIQNLQYDSNPITFNCDPNTNNTARTATITLTYTYGSDNVTKDVTVTQAAAPVIYNTIPALFAAATSTATNVDVTFDDWTVTGVSTNGKNVFVTDGTNGFVIYSSAGDLGNTYTAGDILSGTTTASLKLQNGFAQLTDVDTNNLTITPGGSVAFANIPMADLAGVNTGALVHYEDLTCSINNSKYYLSDGTTTLQVYNSLFAFGALEDGKTYNISGVYQQYNTTMEVLPRSAADIEEVAAPSVPSITIAPATVNAPSGETEGNLTISLENINITEMGGGSFDYIICDAEGVALSDPSAVEAWLALDFPYANNAFSVYYFISENTTSTARTAYFKVYGLDDDGTTEAYSNIITVTQSAFVIDYATLPFEWAGGSSTDFKSLNGVTTYSLGSDYAASNAPYLIKLDGTGDYIQVKTNEQPGVVTIGIKMIGGSNTSTITVQGSSDGENFTDIEELTISGTSNTELTLTTTNAFASTDRYVRMLFTKGSNVGVGPITITKYTTDPVINADDVSLTYDATSGEIPYTITNPASGVSLQATTTASWISNITVNDDKVSFTTTQNDGTEDRIATVTLTYTGAADKTVTVTQAHLVVDYATLPFAFDGGKNDIESTNGLTQEGLDTDYSASPFLKFKNAGTWVILKLNEAPTSLSYDIKGNSFSGGTFNVLTSADGVTYESLATYTELGATQSITHINLASTVRYIKWVYTTKSSGNVALGNIHATANYDIYGTVTVASLSVPATKTCTIYEGGQLIHDTGTIPVTMVKHVKGYTSEKDNYYLITVPFNEVVDPTTVTGMTTGNFDLYEFHAWEPGQEWANFEAQNSFDVLQTGVGYLYAKDTDIDLEFTGTINPSTDSEYYMGFNNDPTAPFDGWEIVGNPFACNTYITGASTTGKGMAFYRMNIDGNGFTAATGAIKPLEGVFVQATADNQSFTFTRTAPVTSFGHGNLNLSIAQVVTNRGEQPDTDNAIIRFDGGSTLEKYSFRENTAKLYITQNGKDYSVVNSEAQGEMPVKFKAAKNGTYTLSITTENIEFGYLHLIDNMTGNDVDLLAIPSYTFESKTSDYTNRFKLVFSANNSNLDGSDNFAFISDGNIIINGTDGYTTVQVIDALGRIIVSRRDGACTVSTDGMTPGVYMIRLINGNDVKTQKIIVK